MRIGIVAGIAVVVLALVAGAYFLLSADKAPSAAPPEKIVAAKQEPEDKEDIAAPEPEPSIISTLAKGAAEAFSDAGVDLAGEEMPDFAMRPIKIYGTVSDAATGAPIAGAKILTDSYQQLVESLEDPDYMADNDMLNTEEVRDLLAAGEPLPADVQKMFDAPTAVSDASGTYELTIDSSMEERVFCRAKGYAMDTRQTNEQSPENFRLDFQLRKGASVSGKVTNLATGEPVGDVQVVAMSDVGMEDMAIEVVRYGSMDNTTTNPDGTFTLGGLGAGRNQIAVRDTKHGWIFDHERLVNVTLQFGEEKSGIDLVVSEGLRAEGKVVDESGEPIENALVDAHWIGGGSYDPFYRNHESPPARSDSSGAFSVIGLLEGKSAVRVEHKDYASRSTQIEIAKGKETPDLEITLVKGSKVSGTAKLKDGTPAKMAMLYLSKKRDENKSSPLELISEDFLDDAYTHLEYENGEFSFEHVPAGEYVLSTEYASMIDEEDKDSIPQVPVVVDGTNDVSNLEIIIPDENTMIDRYVEGKIAGVVLGREGKPAANVGIRTISSEAENYDFDYGDDAETTTKEDGSFEVNIYDEEPQTVFAESDLGEASQSNVKIGDKVTLRLGPLTAITGEVVDEQGNAVPRCKVVLAKPKSDKPETMMEMMSSVMGGFETGDGKSGTTDDFGQFTFKHIKGGDYVVEATSAGQGYGTSERFSIARGSEKGGVRVVMQSGVTFSGLVVDGAGNSVPGTNVSLTASSGNPMETYFAGMPIDIGGSPAAVATSGADGTFSMEGLKPGSFVVSAKHADYAPFSAKNVDVRDSQASPYRITLGKGGGAHGQFLVDGKPKANVMIQLMGEGGMQMARTDSEGRFEIKGLAAGTYMVMPMDMEALESEDHAVPAMNFKSVTITEGGDVVIPFGAGTSVKGTVPAEHLGENNLVYLMRKGAPDMQTLMAGADPMDMMTTGMQMMQHMAGMAEVNEDGTFNLSGVEPGEYELRVYTSDINYDEIDESQFMNMTMEEMQAQVQQFLPKEVLKQPVTIGSDSVTVEFEKPSPETP